MKMMYKLIAASMLTMALGTSAIAQSSTTGTSGTSGTTTTTPGATDTMMMTEADKALTKDWSGPIGDAFFTDDSMTTLKSQDEIKSSWATLSAEQQAQVKQDCAGVSTSTASSTDTTTSGTTATPPTDTTASETTTSGGMSTDTTASTTTGTTTTTSPDTAASASGTAGTDATGPAAGGAAGAGIYSVAMTELCSMITSM
jgi:hypothetical protein